MILWRCDGFAQKTATICKSVQNSRILRDVIYEWPLILKLGISELNSCHAQKCFQSMRAQFHQRSTYSFYALRSQKYYKGLSSCQFFLLFRDLRTQKLCGNMLAKSNSGGPSSKGKKSNYLRSNSVKQTLMDRQCLFVITEFYGILLWVTVIQ